MTEKRTWQLRAAPDSGNLTKLTSELETAPAPGWQHVLSNPGRKVFVRAQDSTLPAAYIKLFYPLGIIERLKLLIGAHACQRAWENTLYLRGKGINVARPLALGYRGKKWWPDAAVWISQAVENATALSAIYPRARDNRHPVRLDRAPLETGAKRALIKNTARTLAGLHNENLYHSDFTADNLLVQNAGSGKARVWVIDLEAVRHEKPLSLKHRLKNLDELGRNYLGLGVISTSDRLRFLKTYLKNCHGLEAVSLKELFRLVSSETHQRLRKYDTSFVNYGPPAQTRA